MNVTAENTALAEEVLAGIGGLRRAIRAATGPGSPFGPMTGAQAELVRLVRRQPGVSVTEAAGELRLAANTVSTLVRQLSEAGMLIREPDPADRRVARLRLAATAETEFARWRDVRVHAVADAVGVLPSDSRRAIQHALPALNELTTLLRDQVTADA